MFKKISGKLALATIGLIAPFGVAQAENLPKNMTWMAYQTTSSGYAQTVAIANMLKQQDGVNIRILPGKNDVSRMTPLRDRNADFCNCGATVWMGQEGVYMFGQKEWGPQPLRILMSAFGSSGLMLIATESSGIQTVADVKGARVATIKGSDSVNWSLQALLAFGGLTLNDVEVVEVSGTGADLQAILDGRVDVTFTSTLSPMTQQVSASNHGLTWLPMPKEDTEGWARVRELAPYFVPNTVTVGTEVSAEAPLEGANYPYPILTANADQDEEVVYQLTKSMVENFDQYKDGAPGATGWALGSQNLQWAIPYHDGTIRYFKEIGKWTEADQAYNDGLVQRQEVLKTAWQDYSAAAASAEGDAFSTGWMAARKAALEAAGLPVIFK
ncbi:TAXI family TRAP transporter solute-binding subunit [Thalassovita sp.]|uniref:TAXI family TRAP transporter solute-binding subunit n=1 Tax=Thalassovita sp. TaxID=1979401 RepID=UPI0029DE8335|nr:TAXI family TRAP transporter solute-binding subunit [Thalassovita sp.]